MLQRYLSQRFGHACVALLSLLPATLLALGACRGSEEPAAAPGVVDDPSALLRLRNLGLAYLEAERHTDAAGIFDELIQLIPAEPMAHANRGLIALRESKLVEAKTHLDSAAELAPDNADIAVLRALVAVYEGDDEIARAVLRHALRADPEHVRARWALVEVLRRHDPEATDAADAMVAHLETLLHNAPGNVVVRLLLTRRLLAGGDLDAAHAHLSVLDELGIAHDNLQARQLLDQVKDRIAAGDAPTARSLVIALNNVAKPSRIWQDSLAQVTGPPVPVADPIRDFLATGVPEPRIDPQSIDVTYRNMAPALGLDAVRAQRAVMFETGAGVVLVAVVDGAVEIHALGAAGRYEQTRRFDLRAHPGDPGPVVTRILGADMNNDRRMDLVLGLADGSARLFVQDDDGNWHGGAGEPLLEPLGSPTMFHVLLPWDADQDGDLDILVGRSGVRAALLRNNADGTFTEIAVRMGIARDGDPTHSPQPALIDAAIGDFDEDGDLDLLMVDATRRLTRLDSRRSEGFEPNSRGVPQDAIECMIVADFDNDGWLDLAFVTPDGSLRVGANLRGAAFDVRTVGAVQRDESSVTAIRSLDFDNDGWLDLLVLAGGRPILFRNTGELTFSLAAGVLPPQGHGVTDVQVVDHDSDGDQDLFVSVAGGACAVWDNVGGNAHGWQDVQLHAVLTGGQRNNAFGLGGFIEIRAGRAYQKRSVRGPVTHFGLGGFGPPDAIRVVWPNGIPQNILLPEPDQLIVEKQSLKGSCPYLLTDDGSDDDSDSDNDSDRQLRFVTDLLWRSPLGMKINAQTVVPPDATRDYVKIESRQLAPRRGRYGLAITAALWETIFVDEVELWAVDHPPGVEIFVDERFLAPNLAPLKIHVVDSLRAPRSAVDHRGRDVLDLIEARDGRRLGGFARGPYQGIAEAHYVELDLGPWPRGETVKLLASGWIMPTDTSINIALSQGSHPPPVPLSVHVPDGAGGWIEVIPDAGFPAGKLKTIVLELSGVWPTDDHRLRLKTNLEIYWDRIAVALGDPPFSATTVALAMDGAELGYLGFPSFSRRDSEAPEIPDYANPTRRPRWRDLHGYYTRFGDVRELLAETDDRYVIMNAGDEIRFHFDTGPAVPAGWVRDFIFFTDGWVKDGDWNTVASQTVRPLPHHGMSSYPPPPDPPPDPDPAPDRQGPASLEPTHPDWQRYHTRYVTSTPFRDRMRPRP